VERTGSTNFYGRDKFLTTKQIPLEQKERDAIKNIQEIGATYLTSTYTKLYQFFALSMIAVVGFLGASYFIGMATTWFPYFGIAFIVLLVSQLAVHIAVRLTFTQITKEILQQ